MLKAYYAKLKSNSDSVAAYGLLETAYQAEFGGSLPEIKKTQNGKPYFPTSPDIHFSLSHSKTHVLCAISDEPIGADIESPRTLRQQVINYYASDEELAEFDPLDLWVLKESYIKLLGGTLILVKKIRFTNLDEKIITRKSDQNVLYSDEETYSKLYHESGCHIALSSYSNRFPETILMGDIKNNG